MGKQTIPPLPVNKIEEGHLWREWFFSVANAINGITAAGSLLWAGINFSGSNITDIATRNHNDLQNIQGGAANDHYHLTSANNTLLTGGGDTTLHYHSADRTVSFDSARKIVTLRL
jgi:hypothetical protein